MASRGHSTNDIDEPDAGTDLSLRDVMNKFTEPFVALPSRFMALAGAANKAAQAIREFGHTMAPFNLTDAREMRRVCGTTEAYDDH